MSESLTSAREAATQVDAIPAPDRIQDGTGVIRLGGGPKKEREPIEMVPLFAIDGKTYKVPSEIRLNVALSILSEIQKVGPIFGPMYALEQVLGPEAYSALLGYEDLDPEDFQAILDRVVKLVFGAAEKESGN